MEPTVLVVVGKTEGKKGGSCGASGEQVRVCVFERFWVSTESSKQRDFQSPVV